MGRLGSIPRGTKGKNSLKTVSKLKLLSDIVQNEDFAHAWVTIPSFVGDVIPCTVSFLTIRKVKKDKRW